MGIFDKASDSLEESDNTITDVESVKETKKKRKSLFDIGTDDNNVPNKKQQEVFENNLSAKTGRQTTVNCDENIKYISQKLSEVPSGIIECRVPEIGLIDLECKVERHSIILLPTKEEAQSAERKSKYAKYIYRGHPSLKEKGNLEKVLAGEGIFSMIS